MTLTPLLENHMPSPEICRFFSSHCSDNPRSTIIIDMFTPVAYKILKNNVVSKKYYSGMGSIMCTCAKKLVWYTYFWCTYFNIGVHTWGMNIRLCVGYMRNIV